MAKSIYVQSNDLSPVIELFNMRPTGVCLVWVGAVKPDSQIYMDIIGTDYELAKWILDKLAIGELHFKLTIHRIRLTKGIVVERAYWQP
jgi:hypothetical protein